MKVLIGCEETQTICQAFRKAGFDAYSCDLRPTQGDPAFHYHMNIFDAIEMQSWDLIILHPPCTAMSLCGNKHYGKGKPKYEQRLMAIEWTKILWQRACTKAKHVALENPASIIFKYMMNVQYVQPWQFGHPVNKKTGFALRKLPHLKPTNIVGNIKDSIHMMPPSKNRARIRSATFPGIADAMVTQWGSHIKGE